MPAPFILFDNARDHTAFLLHGFVRCDTLAPAALDTLDGLLQRGWCDGLHAAVLADYEFGVPLQRLPERAGVAGSLKLLWFDRRDEIADADSWLAQQTGSEPAGIVSPELNRTTAQYRQDIAAIQAAIERGDCYQINHTLRLKLAAYGSPAALYRRLRQPVPYAALARLPAAAGLPDWLLCFSPELFLRIAADGTVATEPMKGTAPIVGDGRDAERAAALAADAKNRAENTMIVDLLRNDLGKIARIGGVSVRDAFKVSAFGSVWQMTSTVRAELPAATRAADIVRAAFPCGSITGAPKRKSMEIIGTLEDSPRGLYTGTLGYLNPEPDSALGFSGCLNVLIRSLELSADPQSAWPWRGRYGVGSGIVADSAADNEYAECGWKARFVAALPPEFGLFETMRAEHGHIALRAQHLARLAASAQELNIPFDIQAAARLLDETLAAHAGGVFRIKLELSPQGSLKAAAAPLVAFQAALNPPTADTPPTGNTVKLLLSPQPLPERDPLRRHKTTRRAAFDTGWQQAEAAGAFDMLFFNRRGELLEGGRSSIIARIDGRWLTPPLAADILNGIARRQALAAGVSETPISRDMLRRAQAVRAGNALRGWLDAEIIWPPENA